MSGRLDVMRDERTVGGPAVTLDSWLAIFMRLLDLPAGDRDGIRCELEAHLRERVRDLIIDGSSEERAVAQAIDELGETAELARRFRSANRYPRRRLAMNLGMSAVGAGIVGLGVVALGPGTGTVSSVPAAWYAQESDEVSEAGLDVRIEASFDDAPLEEVVEFLSATIDRTILVHWRALAENEIYPDETLVSLSARSLPARRLMDLVSESIDDPWDQMAWHIGAELIELGPQDLFDRREISLVSYDVSLIIWSMEHQYDLPYADAVEEITTLLQELVAPDKWMANGGELAQVRVVGGKMFVQAPRRMHHEVAWILEQLSDGDSGETAGAHGAGESVGSYGGGGDAAGFGAGLGPGSGRSGAGVPAAGSGGGGGAGVGTVVPLGSGRGGQMGGQPGGGRSGGGAVAPGGGGRAPQRGSGLGAGG